MIVSGFRYMWLLLMFDLPVRTREQRRVYTHFRNKLLQDGFTRMQYSVYYRHCASPENAEVHIKRVEAIVPADGEVRLITITDKQFERMRVFWGKGRTRPKHPPHQLELF